MTERQLENKIVVIANKHAKDGSILPLKIAIEELLVPFNKKDPIWKVVDASGLLGKYVAFHVGKKHRFGRVVSIEQNIANIRGIEQKGNARAAYHYDIQEIVECSHDTVFKLGRAAIKLLK